MISLLDSVRSISLEIEIIGTQMQEEEVLSEEIHRGVMESATIQASLERKIEDLSEEMDILASELSMERSKSRSEQECRALCETELLQLTQQVRALERAMGESVDWLEMVLTVTEGLQQHVALLEGERESHKLMCDVLTGTAEKLQFQVTLPVKMHSDLLGQLSKFSSDNCALKSINTTLNEVCHMLLFEIQKGISDLSTTSYSVFAFSKFHQSQQTAMIEQLHAEHLKTKLFVEDLLLNVGEADKMLHLLEGEFSDQEQFSKLRQIGWENRRQHFRHELATLVQQIDFVVCEFKSFDVAFRS